MATRRREKLRWPPSPRAGGVSKALSPFVFAPLFLGLPPHGRCIRVLHFEPIRGAAGTAGGILALPDDALEAKLAGVGEDGRAVALHVFGEPDAGAGLGHDRGERGL